jgi:hypothetical protein
MSGDETTGLIARLRPKLEHALVLALIDTPPFADSGSLADAALGVFTAEVTRLEAQVAQLQGERATNAVWGRIPRHAMLDIWVGLKGHPNSFEAWADSVGYAEAWAQLCGWVRHETDVPAALGAATQPEGETPQSSDSGSEL